MSVILPFWNCSARLSSVKMRGKLGSSGSTCRCNRSLVAEPSAGQSLLLHMQGFRCRFNTKPNCRGWRKEISAFENRKARASLSSNRVQEVCQPAHLPLPGLAENQAIR